MSLKCTKCGATGHEAGAKFCHKCGALIFKEPLQEREDTKYIIIHHTAVTTPHTIQDIHKWHLNKGWAGCGYHYFIDKKGKVYIGRPVDTIGAHAKEGGYNRNSIAVCFEGDFSKEKMKDSQLSDEAINLLGLLMFTFNVGLLFCDELDGYKGKPVKGFNKEKIRNRANGLFDSLYQEGMNVFDTDNDELFWDGIESQKAEFGI